MHRDEVPAVADACHTLNRLHTDRRLVALYRLLDALVDSMFPFFAALDDRIDHLQDQNFAKPTEDELAALFALKRQLVDIRKLVSPPSWLCCSCSAAAAGCEGSFFRTGRGACAPDRSR